MVYVQQPTARIHDARYADTGLALYSHNPLIEALPPILSPEQFIAHMTNLPSFQESDRLLAAHQRLHAVSTLTRFFQPLSVHVQLEQRISRLIRMGYVNRNPLKRGFWREVDAQSTQLTGGYDLQSDFRSQRNATLGMSLIGYSGMGKSTALQETLQRGYPQVLRHTEYEGAPFSHIQVSWLIADCPHDGSTRQLCHRILERLDALIGTNYSHYYGKNDRATVDSLIRAIARLAQVHSIGVLVIDEIQRLNRARSGGAHRMMEFFVELINVVGIPIILVGTPDANGLLSQRFSMARRAAGQGDRMWSPMRNDGEWRMFVERMWRYQFTATPTPLTNELSDLLHYESVGVLDIAIKIYGLAQIRAITTGREQVTTRIIQSVCRDNLVRLQPMLNALRNNDFAAMSHYPDLEPINLDLEISKAVAKSTRSGTGRSQKAVGRKEAGATTTGSVKEPDSSSASSVNKGGSKPKRRKRHKKGTQPPASWKLSIVAYEAKAKGESVHDALLEAGFIAAPLDLESLA